MSGCRCIHFDDAGKLCCERVHLLHQLGLQTVLDRPLAIEYAARQQSMRQRRRPWHRCVHPTTQRGRSTARSPVAMQTVQWLRGGGYLVRLVRVRVGTIRLQHGKNVAMRVVPEVAPADLHETRIRNRALRTRTNTPETTAMLMHVLRRA